MYRCDSYAIKKCWIQNVLHLAANNANKVASTMEFSSGLNINRIHTTKYDIYNFCDQGDIFR